MDFLAVTQSLSENTHIIWTFLLLIVRFSSMMIFLPGIGMGEQGLQVRMAAVISFALASALGGQYAHMPSGMLDVTLQTVSEVILGGLLAFIPYMIVAGVQTGAQLSSTTMGLGAGQLLDPTMGVSVTSLAKLFGDLVVLLFLLLGGHYLIIHTVAGLGGTIVPGTFLLGEKSLNLLVNRSADIFRVGVMISAPVIVALLLTQFVLGLISKAVPTVNIFIISFPLTIGIGLILSALSFPDVLVFSEHEINAIENSLLVIVQEAERVLPQASLP